MSPDPNVLKISRVEYRKWNDLIDEVKPLSESLVYEKINKIVEFKKLPKEIIDSVLWDMLHLGMECEYSDIVKPEFYAGLAYWYKVGHFPCGLSNNNEVIVY